MTGVQTCALPICTILDGYGCATPLGLSPGLAALPSPPPRPVGSVLVVPQPCALQFSTEPVVADGSCSRTPLARVRRKVSTTPLAHLRRDARGALVWRRIQPRGCATASSPVAGFDDLLSPVLRSQAPEAVMQTPPAQLPQVHLLHAGNHAAPPPVLASAAWPALSARPGIDAAAPTHKQT